MFDLRGRVAIVTGAGTKRGIGRATSYLLSKKGAIVVLCDIDEKGIAEGVKKIKKEGNKAIALKVDVSSEKEIQKVVEYVKKKLGRIDILINNAAISQDLKVIDISIKDWERVLDVNLKGPFLFSKAVLPIMISQNFGRIINMSSVAAKTGCVQWGGAHYSASKAGLLGFSKHLVKEVSPYGITVNCVTPGIIATDIRGGLENPEEQVEISKRIPVGRFGKPEEVGAVICFLASEEAGYITGEDIDINGGVYLD